LINPTLNPTLKYTLLAVLTLPVGMTFAQAPTPAAAQSTTAPPVGHHRAPKDVVVTPEQIRATAAEMQRNTMMQLPGITGMISAPNPNDVDIPLPPNGISAIQQANKFLFANDPPTVDEDGWVTYQYGRGYPLVILKPDQLSTVRLAKGEFVQQGQLEVGDNRIQVVPIIVGSGTADAQTYLAIKCKNAGESSDIVFATNLRPYTIRVISKPLDYTPRVAFTYPDDEQKQAWKEYHDRQRQDAADHAAVEQARLAQVALEQAQRDAPPVVRNTNYHLKFKGKGVQDIAPTAVFDDGLKTYIDLGPLVARGLPIAHTFSATTEVPSNSTWQTIPNGKRLTLDGIFYRVDLEVGVGRHQQRVVIINKSSKATAAAETQASEVQSARR
jgi:hypothetical protein